MKKLGYTVEIHPAEREERGFWASVPELPGCFSRGDTLEEAAANIEEAIRLYLDRK